MIRCFNFDGDYCYDCVWKTSDSRDNNSGYECMSEARKVDQVQRERECNAKVKYRLRKNIRH